jgi:superfamily II DNA or RNA helicase
MAPDEVDELERLRRELRDTTAERDRLLAENRRLTQYSVSDPAPTHGTLKTSSENTGQHETAERRSPNLPTTSAESPLSERVQLFRSLFRGREDVHATLWHSKQSQKSGYSPVCTREWDRAFCGKPNVKCGNCPNRELAPLTDLVVQNHLDGKITLGIYPLLESGTCHFLAVDFDKQSWIDDSGAFYETCRIMGIPASIERSRSGKGAHIWVFFSEAVSASSARNLGCYLLTETMSRRHQLGMDSYDRLFPNQDTVPKGGFGNLIALPLQKTPSENGNALFVDSLLEPYHDQWKYLAKVGRMTPPALEDVVREAVRTGQVMGACLNVVDDEDQPWTWTPSRRTREAPLTDPLPARLKVVASNLIYVEKEGLSSSSLNRMKRLAAFQNPEFYKRQRLRLSTALTPRVICCAEEFPRHLAIPRGCLDELRDLMGNAGVDLEVEDRRLPGKEITAVFRGQLSPAQQAAVSALQLHDSGLLVAPSGSGKTVVGIYMIAARKTNTLVLVHRRPLLEQWRSQLAKFLDVDPAVIGQIGGGKGKVTGFIDVAMIQSLGKKGEVDDLVAGYGQVIVDECHHLPAVTFEQILRQVKARYVIGVTATPYRRDGQQPIILMQCGPIRHVISQKDQQVKGSLRHRLICRDTSFAMPAQGGESSIHDIYAALVGDEIRNQQIVDDLLRALDEGRSPILLTERREHLDLFAERLTKSVPNVVVLRGGMGTRQRRSVAEQLAAISNDEKRVVLATGRYVGEGFDDPRLDTLFLAMPVSWKGTLIQYAGRLHRLHSGKTEARIYDYVDRNCLVLMKMFWKRLRGYRSIGYEPGKPYSRTNAGDRGEGAVISMPTLWDALDST